MIWKTAQADLPIFGTFADVLKLDRLRLRPSARTDGRRPVFNGALHPPSTTKTSLKLNDVGVRLPLSLRSSRRVSPGTFWNMCMWIPRLPLGSPNITRRAFGDSEWALSIGPEASEAPLGFSPSAAAWWVCLGAFRRLAQCAQINFRGDDMVRRRGFRSTF